MVQRLVEMLEIGLSMASISWDTTVPGALGLYSAEIPREKAGPRLCSSSLSFHMMDFWVWKLFITKMESLPCIF